MVRARPFSSSPKRAHSLFGQIDSATDFSLLGTEIAHSPGQNWLRWFIYILLSERLRIAGRSLRGRLPITTAASPGNDGPRLRRPRRRSFSTDPGRPCLERRLRPMRKDQREPSKSGMTHAHREPSGTAGCGEALHARVCMWNEFECVYIARPRRDSYPQCWNSAMTARETNHAELLRRHVRFSALRCRTAAACTLSAGVLSILSRPKGACIATATPRPETARVCKPLSEHLAWKRIISPSRHRTNRDEQGTWPILTSAWRFHGCFFRALYVAGAGLLLCSVLVFSGSVGHAWSWARVRSGEVSF